MGFIINPYAYASGNDPHWANVVLLVAFSGADGSTTFTDLSTVGRTLTAVGNVQVDTAITKFGNPTGLFDGTGDYITAPNAADISVANETDKTIECFFYLNATGRIHTLVDKRDTTNAEEFSFQITAANVLQFAVFGAATVRASIVSATTLSISTWYHGAAVRTGGDTWQLFLDGVSQGTDVETAQPQSNTETLTIGRSKFNTARDLQGHMAQLRYTNAARYTGNFSPPSAPFPTA